jgi:hypothetical protein
MSRKSCDAGICSDGPDEQDANTHRPAALTMNGATFNVPNWKADSEGVVIAVFDQGGS